MSIIRSVYVIGAAPSLKPPLLFFFLMCDSTKLETYVRSKCISQTHVPSRYVQKFSPRVRNVCARMFDLILMYGTTDDLMQRLLLLPWNRECKDFDFIQQLSLRVSVLKVNHCKVCLCEWQYGCIDSNARE